MNCGPHSTPRPRNAKRPSYHAKYGFRGFPLHQGCQIVMQIFITEVLRDELHIEIAILPRAISETQLFEFGQSGLCTAVYCLFEIGRASCRERV